MTPQPWQRPAWNFEGRSSCRLWRAQNLQLARLGRTKIIGHGRLGPWAHAHFKKKHSFGQVNLDAISTSSEYFTQCRKTKKLQNMKPLELRDSIASKAAFWSFEAHSSVVWIWPGSFGEFGPLPPDQQVDHCASFDMPGPDEEDPKLRPEPEKKIPKIWYCQ
jgi:hypothetical protein